MGGGGQGYREWLIPVATLNPLIKSIRIVPGEGGASAAWVKRVQECRGGMRARPGQTRISGPLITILIAYIS